MPDTIGDLRAKIKSGRIGELSIAELTTLAIVVKEPIYPSECVDWAEREAIPLIRELGKRLQFQSVLQDWVMKLPLREQGVLLTGVRGCDLAPKMLDCIDEKYGCSTGEGSPERQLAAFLRYCFMNPADAREIDIPGSFFRSKPPEVWKPSMFGHFPLHWYSHMMHCFEVIGYRHPNNVLASHGLVIYARFAHALHLPIETKEQMIERLSEDRIEKNNVVS